jgi:hypothetical protein
MGVVGSGRWGYQVPPAVTTRCSAMWRCTCDHHRALGIALRDSGPGCRVKGPRDSGQGCRVNLSGSRVKGRDWVPGCRVKGPGSRVQGQGKGLGSRVQGEGSRVQGEGIRVPGAAGGHDQMLGNGKVHLRR